MKKKKKTPENWGVTRTVQKINFFRVSRQAGRYQARGWLAECATRPAARRAEQET